MQGSSFAGAPPRSETLRFGMMPDDYEDEGSRPMDYDAEEDDKDDDDEKRSVSVLTPAQKATPSLRNPLVTFMDTVGMLTETCPLAFYNPYDGGLTFGMVSANLDAECKDKFAEKLDTRLVRATTHGFDENVTNLCIVSHFLPMPVHYSPLMAMLEGIKCSTFTDSISSIRQLFFIRAFYYRVALDDAEYCRECERAYHRIHGEATDRFFQKIDELFSKKGEIGLDMATVMFAAIVEEYQLARIRSVEWNILDMLGVPLAYRQNFLTPTAIPDGSRLTMAQGEVLIKNLVFYLKKRKEIYAGSLEILAKNRLLDRPNKKDRMDIDAEDEEEPGVRSCNADQLQVLTLERDFAQPASPKYKGWLCVSTLQSYMNFLDFGALSKKVNI